MEKVVIAGKRMILLEETEYQKLCASQAADEDREPPMPEPDAEGCYPALETCQAHLARDLIRSRKALGLTRAELAKLAHVRLETLRRLESGQHLPSVRAVDKIDRVLVELEKRRNGRKGKTTSHNKRGRRG